METTKNDSQELTVSDVNSQSSFLNHFGKKFALYAGATALVGMFGVPAVFSWIGFGSVGVTAGSWAAWWQATHFAPGIFSLVQSATATGAVSALATKVGVGGAVIKAYYDARMKNQNNQASPSSQEE